MALHIASYRTSAGGCVFAGMAFWFPLMLRSAAEVLAIDFIRSPAIFTSCRRCARRRISVRCRIPMPLSHVSLRFGGAGKGIQWVTSHCIKGPEGVIQRSLSKEVRRINSDLKGSGSGSFISMAITISPSDGFCCLASIHLFIYDSFIVHALG